jgi:stress response protein SCP2
MTTTPLLHTKKSRERIIVAIRWDERGKTTIIDTIRGTNQQHDLDVSCFVYNRQGEYIDFVGSMAQDHMDHTGCIYHSGDDAGGAGGGDDEFISCELAGLPDDTDHLIFVTEIRSDHTFKDVFDPYMRLADGMTNNNLHEMHMAKGKGLDTTACVMARIFRDRYSPTGWSLHIIDEYPKLDDVSDWGSYLTRYL